MSGVLLESRPFRPFKSSEEYLFAMKEDLAEWLQMLYPQLQINIENFMERLETGVALCVHANAVKIHAVEYVRRKEARRMMMTKSTTGSLAQAQSLIEIPEVKYRATAKAGTFFARDNLSNFIQWCRECLKILECLLFESDDLIMRKNEKHVILCLLEVARRGAKFGMLAPMLVQMERQIDREIAADQRMQASLLSEAIVENNQADDEESDSEMEDEQPMMMYGPIPQIVTNDLKSLDEMVRDLVERCTCATQFPMIRVSEGKYRIGDTKVLIFVRILRNHVMVRVGGGWDTLSHYLDKHDPCRCRAQHRAMQGAKLVNRIGMDLQGAQVIYDRSAGGNSTSFNSNSLNSSPSKASLGPPMNSLNRSRSRSPTTYNLDRRSASPYMQRKSLMPIPAANRSRSPTPKFVSTHITKLSSPKKHTSIANNGSHIRGDSGPQSLPPTFNSVKQRHPSNHVTHLLLPSAEATPSGGTKKTEAVLMVNGTNGAATGSDSTDHSDNASEVSDEGYRSLGIIADKKHRTSLHSQNSIEDADEIERPVQSDQDNDYDTNDCGLRKTAYSSMIYGDVNSTSSNHCKSPEKQAPPLSNTKTPKVPPSPKKSASSSRLNLTLNSHSNINNTWNGRQRQRPSLTNETFSSFNSSPNHNTFTRNSPTRRSMSVPKYDQNGRRVSQSASTSPNKCIKDDLAQILTIDNEEVLMIEMNKLLKQYNFRVVEDDSITKRRKDSKPENSLSRIPAPIK